MYRFHPSVSWNRGYPDRKQIVSQITQIWQRYGLEERTKFNTRVKAVTKDGQGRWIVNDPSNGRFDGVIAAVGTCGDPKIPHIAGQEKFNGQIYHSSELDGKHAQGKKVLVVGGGASAVEALEFVVHEDAKETSILTRVSCPIVPLYRAIRTRIISFRCTRSLLMANGCNQVKNDLNHKRCIVRPLLKVTAPEPCYPSLFDVLSLSIREICSQILVAVGMVC